MNSGSDKKISEINVIKKINGQNPGSDSTGCKFQTIHLTLLIVTTYYSLWPILYKPLS